MLVRATLLRVSVVALAAAAFASACTTLLGDDFEIGPGGAGASSQGGSGAANTGGGATGGGNTGGGGPDCGNGQPDPGELCDADCPVECMDVDPCTSDHLDGSPFDCNAQCLFEPVVTCIDNDGCCANGCYNDIDNDCQPNVLIVSNDANGVPSVQSALADSGLFGLVEVFDAAFDSPSLDLLTAFDAALVYAQYQAFGDPLVLGDVLADFHDQGGRVVVANGANCFDYAFGGRFVDDGYLALDFGNIYPTPDSLGPVDVPNTPLLNYLDVLLAEGHCNGGPTPGSTVVARYADSGDAILAYRWVGDRRRVDLNVFPSPPWDVLGVLIGALLFQ